MPPDSWHTCILIKYIYTAVKFRTESMLLQWFLDPISLFGLWTEIPTSTQKLDFHQFRNPVYRH